MDGKMMQNLILFMILHPLLLFGSSCSMAQHGALLSAEKAYSRHEYRTALGELANAERYTEIPDNQKAYVSLLRALCFEGLDQKQLAVGVYEYIIASFPDSEQAYSARRRLQTLEPKRTAEVTTQEKKEQTGLTNSMASASPTTNEWKASPIPTQTQTQNPKSDFPQDQLQASSGFFEGMSALRAGHYDKAIALFENLNKSDPNYLIAIGFKAVSLIWLHKPADAEALLAQSLQEHPKSIVLLGAMASVLQENGKPREASTIADNLIKLSARTAWEYNTLAGAYLLKGDVDAAIKNFSKAIEIDPTRAEFYDSRGLAYGRKQYYQKEIEDHTKAIEIDPNAAVAYMNRGVAYGYQKKYGNALKDYDQAVAINEELAMAYVNRGATRRILNDVDIAIADYNKAISIDVNLPIAYYNRGIAYRYKNDFVKATGDYTKAIALKPDYQEAYHSRGVAYSKIGDMSKGCSDWKKAYELGQATPTGQSAYRNWKSNCSQ